MNDTKKCPYCGEEIKAEAKKCRYCGEWLVQKEDPVPNIEMATTVQSINNNYEDGTEIKVEKKDVKFAKDYLKMMRVPSDVLSLCDKNEFWKAITSFESRKKRMSVSEYNTVLAYIYMRKMVYNGEYQDYQRVEDLLNEAVRGGTSGDVRTSINYGRQALKKIYRDHLMPKEEREEEDIQEALKSDKEFIVKHNYYDAFAKRFGFLDNGKDIIASADPSATANPYWAKVRTTHNLSKKDIPLYVRYRSDTDTFAITSQGVSHYNKDKGFELQKLSWQDIDRVEHRNGQLVFIPSDEMYTLNNLKVDDYDAVKFGDDDTINRFITVFMSIRDVMSSKRGSQTQQPTPSKNIADNTLQPSTTSEASQVVATQPTTEVSQAISMTQEQAISPAETSRCLAKYGLESLMDNENIKPLIPIIVDMAKMDEMMDDFVEQAGKVDEAIQEFKGQVYDAAADIFNESMKIRNRKMQNVGMAAAGVVAIGGFALAKWQEWKNEQRQADRAEAMMEMKQKMARVKDPNIVALHDMIVKRLPQLQKLYFKEMSKDYLPSDKLLDKKVYAFKITFFLYGKMLYMADLSNYFHLLFERWKELETLDDMPPLQNDTLASLVEKWDNNATMQLMRNGSPNEKWPVYSLLTISDPFILQSGLEEQLIEDVDNKTEFSSAATKALNKNRYYRHVCSMYEKKPWNSAIFYLVSILASILGVLFGWVFIGVLIEQLLGISMTGFWLTVLLFAMCWLAYKVFKIVKSKYLERKDKWMYELYERFDFKLNNKTNKK